MKNVVVVDLDGTLANIDHRVHLIKREKPDWDAFFKACGEDVPNQWCVDLINALSPTFDIRIVSARSRVAEEETREWLMHVFGGDMSGIELELLREAGNTDQDVELKRAWLNRFGRERIVFAVDDRQRVVDMWRAEGLTCLQCYQWAEFKKKPKADL